VNLGVGKLAPDKPILSMGWMMRLNHFSLMRGPEPPPLQVCKSIGHTQMQ